MKRLTISLPDDLVNRIKDAAGQGSVSAYVAAALRDYTERESLDDILADWDAETPVAPELQRRVEEEFDRIGMIDVRAKDGPAGEQRQAG